MHTRIKASRFWLVWIAASLAVYPMAIILLALFSIVWNVAWQAVLPNRSGFMFDVFNQRSSAYFLYQFLTLGAAGGLIGFGVGMLQGDVVKRHLHIDLSYWRRATVVGGIIAAPILLLASTALSDYFNANYWMIYQSGQRDLFQLLEAVLPMTLYVSVMSILQTIILRRYVKQAWLWVLANSVAGLMFSMLARTAFDPGFFQWLLAALAQGAVTGFAMLWLFLRLNKPEAQPLEPAFQYVPIDIDNEEPRDPSVWDDAI
jgi:hypothetical protein